MLGLAIVSEWVFVGEKLRGRGIEQAKELLQVLAQEMTLKWMSAIRTGLRHTTN